MRIDGVERAGRKLGRISLRLRRRLRKQRRSMALITKLCDSLGTDATVQARRRNHRPRLPYYPRRIPHRVVSPSRPRSRAGNGTSPFIIPPSRPSNKLSDAPTSPGNPRPLHPHSPRLHRSHPRQTHPHPLGRLAHARRSRTRPPSKSRPAHPR